MSTQPTMRAAIYRRRGEVDVVDLPRPGGETDALVAVEYCGICGTDLHMMLDGWGPPDSVFGHEWSGRIHDPGTTGLATGTLVVGLPSPACGSCALCRAGRTSLCRNRPEAGTGPERGAFAEFVAAGADRLFPVPSGVDARAAAYTEPLAVALHAITRSGLSVHPPRSSWSGPRVHTEGGHDQRALVMGAGPIGAAIIAVLAGAGIATAAVEPGEHRAALAHRLGAEVRAVEDLEITAHPGAAPADAVDVVFETSGARAAVETALTQLKPGGTLVLVGTGLDLPQLDTNRVILNELEVTGAFNYDADGFADALTLIGSGSLPLDDLLAPDEVRLDDLLATMHRLRTGSIAGKALVRPMGRTT
ncbi:MAG: alcohol dehydrogenase catalytic domain-containing protein [Acidimicrobiales bacterium]